MTFRIHLLASHSLRNLFVVALLVFAGNQVTQAESLKPQIEIQAYIDPSLYELFGNDAGQLVEDSLVYTQKNLQKALNINSILAPIVPAALKDRTFKSGLDEMTAFARSISEADYFKSADIHVLFSMPRENSWAFGLSYQNSICSSEQRNILIVRLSSPAFTALTLTHEIGHMLGAEHESDSSNLMNPLFGIPWPEHFSKLGTRAIKNHLLKVGHCLLWNTGINQTIRVIPIGKNRIKLLWQKGSNQSSCKLKSYKLSSDLGISNKLARVQTIGSRARQKLIRLGVRHPLNLPSYVWALDCGGILEQRSGRI